MIYHVLNGDALLDRFEATKLPGQIIIDRECLIVGDVSGDTLANFWEVRAGYIAATYYEERSEYYGRVVDEFDRMLTAPSQSEFNLWFGYDLFCQANMWFVLSLLYNQSKEHKVNIVYPTFLKGNAIWDDFGRATVADLLACETAKIACSDADLQLGKALWNAYKTNALAELDRLSATQSPCFPHLKAVCKAHIDRFNTDGGKGRPQRVVDEIISDGITHFPDVFQAFFQREGVYGFGDSQVKELYDNVMGA